MRLKFDDYVLDVGRCELWRGSARVAIEPQVFDLLAYLVQNHSRVVSRDQLLQAIWDGRAISDSAIANRINGARRAIGDSGEAQRLIRTVPRKGFRFIRPVDELPPEVAVGSLRANFHLRTWPLAGVAFLGAAIAIALGRPETFFASHPTFSSQAGALPSVLVSALPTKLLGAGANDLSLPAITADKPAFDRAAPPRSTAKVVPAAAKPVVAASMEQEPNVPPQDVVVATPAPIEHMDPISIAGAQWSVIPCVSARIDLGPGSTCRASPPVSTGGHCDIARQQATITNARYQIDAVVRIFDPYKITATGPQGKNCAVWSGYRNMPDDFKNINQMTQRGTDWTGFVKGDLQSSVSFVDGGRNCIAVERLGPRWHGGYVWVLHASICPTAAGSVQTADIDAAFAALQLRTYDAQANLRTQSQ
jgi:DNA-binding winged helix-turn-helix (wHTH) protein